MSLNCSEIDAVLAELALEGSHIQKIRQPDYHSLVFDLYSPGERFRLLISLQQGKTRLHRLSGEIRRKVKLQRFAQLLRARILGGRIIEARQLDHERILRLVIRRSDENTLLWIRLWTGAAQVIAAEEDGTILDAFYRRPGRGEVSGGVFRYHPADTVLSATEAVKRYPPRSFPGAEDYNGGVEAYYNEQIREEEWRINSQRIERYFNEQERRLRNRRKRLDSAAKRAEQTDWKQWGDLILSFAYRVEPGAAEMTAENYYGGGETVVIPLDPAKNPQENAEVYYRRAKKAKAGERQEEEERQNLHRSLAELQAERDKLLSGDDPEILKRFLAQRKQEKSTGGGDGPPGLLFHSGGFSISVGRTAAENDELLRHHVRGNDTWLHTRDYPGGYVFIRAKSGKSIPLDVLLDAGNLALYYSKGRSGGQGDLYYTRVKYLRRAKEARKGTVLPTQEKNLHIKLDEARLARLRGKADE